MGLIILEGMRFHAPDGFYEEEQILGNDFIIDIHITTNFSMAAATDDLYNTINYETIYLICQIVMDQPTRLIETLTERIIMGLKHQFATIQEVRVCIKKLNPPLGGRVDVAIVEDSDNFVSGCGRCGRGFICYGDETCWCRNVDIHAHTQEVILRQYQKCLCKNCLDFYAG